MNHITNAASAMAQLEQALLQIKEGTIADSALSRHVEAAQSAARHLYEIAESAVRERADSIERLTQNHAAIMQLARSESLSRGALDEALREITETAAKVLGVERSSVWVYNGDQTAILCLELFQQSKRSHESGIELGSASFPAYFDALKAERTIAAHNAHTDPRTGEFSASYLTPLGINSMLDAPIRVGGRMIGVICNEHVGPARTWTIEEEQFSASLADFIALAMESNERRETEIQLRTMLQEYESAE
ncbi:MAG: GAF domain-containing protein [Polyangiaceae bacterium]|nr:GAF domain-containing protein [Polyangiaceae bacterium]